MGLELTFAPQALPGACRLCGSSTRLPFVDTKCSEEYHGAVYYCKECVFEMAGLYGFVHPDSAVALEFAVDELTEHNQVLLAQVDNLEKAIDGLVNSGKYTITAVPDGVLLEAITEPATRSSGESESVGEGENGTPESSNDERLGELRSSESRNDATSLSN